MDMSVYAYAWYRDAFIVGSKSGLCIFMLISSCMCTGFSNLLRYLPTSSLECCVVGRYGKRRVSFVRNIPMALVIRVWKKA